PIDVRMPRMASPAWVVAAGQPGTVTEPPVAAAAARYTAALDRSGSISQSRAEIGPGSTCHGPAPGPPTRTPCARSIRTVISMCGSDGTGLPPLCTVTPWVNRAADSSRPDTNWEDADASIVTSPPGNPPRPRTVNGSVSPSTSAPRD